MMSSQQTANSRQPIRPKTTGQVKAIFRKVKVDGHVDEVLAAVKA